jgi:hypothetical protein
MIPTIYRKALVLAAVAAAGASGAWAVQGWRMGKQLAEQKATYQARDIRRTNVALEDWHKAGHQAAQEVLDAKAKLRIQRQANAALLAKLQAARAQLGPDFACMDKPLPESYLETFRK